MESELIAKRALWLAYEASPVIGMGIFSARDDMDEQKFWDAVAPKNNRAYVDYGFGRMMKIGLRWDEKGVHADGGDPRPDYQGWSVVYPTYAALITAALESLTVPA